MFCRICGHDNGDRGTGTCSKCGFDLEYQNRPLKEQREPLQKVLDKPLHLEGSKHLEVFAHKRTGLFGVALGILGLIICIIILASFQRAQVATSMETNALANENVPDVPVDSLPVRVGSDIVYELNDAANSAEPHTNLNLSLIPEGSTVAFIASGIVPIKPLVIYMDQKNREGEQADLDLDRLCLWTDDTRTAFETLPLIVQPAIPDTSATRPVALKILFTDQWLVGRVEEFSIEIPSPLPGGEFNQAKLDSVLTQVSRRLENRDLGERQVEVTVMFSETTLLGDAFEVMQAVLPSIESRGYLGLGLRYFLLES